MNRTLLPSIAFTPVAIGCAAESGTESSSDEMNSTPGGRDVCSIMRTEPEPCPLFFQPVCGCDGNTYVNACVASNSVTGWVDGTCSGADAGGVAIYQPGSRIYQSRPALDQSRSPVLDQWRATRMDERHAAGGVLQ